MPSDIYIKSSSSTWRKMTNLFIKSGSTTWRTATAIWLYFNSSFQKVWPLSGVFSTSSPYVAATSGSTTPLYGVDGAIRIGTTYYGKNGTWNANGWTINSYQYKWIGYSTSDVNDSTKTVDPALATYTGTVSYTLPASYDRTYLSFFIQANSSGGTAYNGTDESGLGYGRLQAVRRPPINLSKSIDKLTPKVGDVINWSSSWDTSTSYLPEASRTTIEWYKNSTASTTGGTWVSSGSYSYTVQSTDSGYYIYGVETCYNSGTDYDYGLNTGVSVSAITTSKVSAAPNAFTYSLSNTGTVTTPPTPSITRVSSASNIVLFELNSSFPSDTEYYGVNQSGAAFGTRTGTPAQNVFTLNQWDATGTSSPYGNGTYSYDTISTIESGSSNAEMTISTLAYGKTRSATVDVNTTTGAYSWAINFSWSGASSYGVTYYSNGTGTNSSSTAATVTVYTNSMPVKIVDVTGSADPTITINNITAYSALNQSGVTTAGTAGSPTSFTLTRPKATSGSTTQYYSYYTNYQSAGNQRRTYLPSNFTSGTTVYVSTNGYIGIGTDPGTSIYPPASGTFLMPLQGDQRQTALWYYADASNFYIRWQGARYNDSAQTIDYQAKFYWNSTAVDVYFVTNNLSVSNTAPTDAVRSNGTITQTWPGSSAQSSSLISTGSMTRNTSQDNVDDNNTAITAAALSAPSISASVSPTTGTAGSTTYYASSTTTGNPSPTVTYSWQYFSNSSFSWVQYTTGTQFTPASNINTVYPNYGWQMVATATNSQGSATSSVSITINNPAVNYTVTWNANGGSVSPSSNTVSSGSSVTAPTPTRSGYSFNGWYNASSGGSYIVGAGGSYTVSSNVTLYAQWTANATAPSTPTGFSISASGLATWTAVSGATGYYLNIWYASNSSGANAYSAGVYTVPGGNTTSYQLPYGTNPSTGVYCNYADGQIAAYNSAGTSNYSAWYPSASTYV